MWHELHRSPLWITTLVASVLGTAVAGLFPVAQGAWALAVLPIAVAGVAGMVLAPANIRPGSSLMAAGFFLGVGIFAISVHSFPSLWYSISGEKQVCEIVDLDKHTRRTSSSYHHDIVCRDGELTYRTNAGFAGNVGDRVLFVTDPSGLVEPELPAELSQAKAWRLPIAVLIGFGFTVLVATKPRRVHVDGHESNS